MQALEWHWLNQPNSASVTRRPGAGKDAPAFLSPFYPDLKLPDPKQLLTVGGGGWRMPTIPELKALYQKGASRVNMDPLFQAKGAWVWSGQMHDARTAWGFAFYSGLVNSHGLNYAYGRLAFAVRSRR